MEKTVYQMFSWIFFSGMEDKVVSENLPNIVTQSDNNQPTSHTITTATREFTGTIFFHTLVYTEFILVWLCRKLEAYRHTLGSVPGTNQYWATGVKFLAQENNDKPLTGFEPTPFLQSFNYKSDALTTWSRRHLFYNAYI